jgi:hypothetical protein
MKWAPDIRDVLVEDILTCRLQQVWGTHLMWCPTKKGRWDAVYYRCQASSFGSMLEEAWATLRVVRHNPLSCTSNGKIQLFCDDDENSYLELAMSAMLSATSCDKSAKLCDKEFNWSSSSCGQIYNWLGEEAGSVGIVNGFD